MSDLERQIEDLIAAAGLDDADADELRAAIDQVRAKKDAQLRGDVQRTVGETYLSLRDKMDRIIDLQIDTRGVLDTVVHGVEGVEAALGAARAEFQGGLNAVGERVSQLTIDISVVSNDVAVLREEAKRQNIRLGHLEAGQKGLRADISELNERHGGQIDAITEEQTRQAGQLTEMMRIIEELRAESADRLSGEEQRAKVAQIANHEERLKRLEERDKP